MSFPVMSHSRLVAPDFVVNWIWGSGCSAATNLEVHIYKRPMGDHDLLDYMYDTSDCRQRMIHGMSG